MTPLEREEFLSLRATIRERGTARHWMVVLGVAVWSALAISAAALGSIPLVTLLPLLFLAAVFEVAFALHTGVERVGRYLQVFYEDDTSPRAWEHVAMAYGRAFGGSGVDPLFSPIFLLATV